MTYTEWHTDNSTKKSAIIAKLKQRGMSATQIVDYFDFENMKQQETSYCRLYETATKCHDTETLNCFFCGCPYFIFDDAGLSTKGSKVVYSKCTIDAIKGAEFTSDVAIHQDCSKCDIPHRPVFAYRLADRNIKEISGI